MLGASELFVIKHLVKEIELRGSGIYYALQGISVGDERSPSPQPLTAGVKRIPDAPAVKAVTGDLLSIPMTRLPFHFPGLNFPVFLLSEAWGVKGRRKSGT